MADNTPAVADDPWAAYRLPQGQSAPAAAAAPASSHAAPAGTDAKDDPWAAFRLPAEQQDKPAPTSPGSNADAATRSDATDPTFMPGDLGMAPTVSPTMGKEAVRGAGKIATGLLGLQGDLGKSAGVRPQDNPVYMGDGMYAPVPAPTSDQINADIKARTGVDLLKPPANKEQAAGQIAGQVLANAPLMFLGGEGAPAEALPLGGRLLRMAGNAVRSGAAAGGLSFLESPGSATDRLTAGGEGAATGAGISFGGNLARELAHYVPLNRIPGLDGLVSPNAVETAAAKFGDIVASPQDRQAVSNATNGVTEGYRPTLTEVLPNNDKAGTLEQQARTQNPGQFNAVQQQQRASEVGAMNRTVGEGNPDAVKQGLDTTQQTMQQRGDAALQQAQTNAQTAAGDLPASAHSDIPANGSNYGTTADQQYGASARGTVLTGERAMKDRLNDLETQINTDGQVVIPTNKVGQANQSVYGDLANRPNALPPSGLEAQVARRLQDMPPNMRMQDFSDLDDTINAAIEEAKGAGNNVAVRRLMQIKQASRDAVSEGVANAAAGNATPTPGSLADRLMTEQGVNPGQPILTPDSNGISNPRFMTPDEATLYNQYRDLRQEYMGRYGSGVLKDLLGEGENPTAAQVAPNVTRAKGSFGVSDADVLGRVLDGSRNEADNVTRLMAAAKDAGTEAQTIGQLKAYLADEFRRTVMTQDGQVNPEGWRGFWNRHRSALNTVPELNQAFDGLSRAQQTVQQIAEQNAADLKAFQTKPVKGFQDTQYDQATRSIFNSGNPAKNLDDVIAKMGNDPAAMEGLKRSVGNYVAAQYGRGPEAFANFVAQRRGELVRLYGEDGAKMFEQIVKQMQGRNASADALARAQPGPKPESSGHGIGEQVFSANVLEELVKEFLTPEQQLGMVTAKRGLGAAWSKIRESYGIRSAGDLLNAAAKDPSRTGKALLDALAHPNSPMMINRLAAAIGAGVGTQRPF